MRVGENSTEARPEASISRRTLTGDALRKWAYQYYIKDYLRCMQSVDDNVGRMLDYLDADGLADDTIVIYTSDQGFFLGDHGWYDKRLMYEESLRMPFLIRYPGAIRPGTVNERHGAERRLRAHLSRLRAAAKRRPKCRAAASARIWKATRPRTGARRCTTATGCTTTNDHHVPAHYGVRTHRYKLIYYYGKPLGMSGAHPPATEPDWELYDLEKDPREMQNLYHDPALRGRGEGAESGTRPAAARSGRHAGVARNTVHLVFVARTPGPRARRPRRPSHVAGSGRTKGSGAVQGDHPTNPCQWQPSR